jgi:PTH2 family peptidyl-tRNA hydrolase
MKNERQLTEPKQVIVIRKDLNMSAGKLAAQVSHASWGTILNLMQRKEEDGKYEISMSLDLEEERNKAIQLWLEKRFTKIIVYVKSEIALLNVYEKAKAKNMPVALIQDAGFTEFDGVPTYTCVGIGPSFPKEFDGVTNKLRKFDGEVITS